MTDQANTPDGAEGAEGAAADQAAAPSAPEAAPEGDQKPAEGAPVADGPDHEALAAQRLEDLQRLNAEYVNYKRRVDRDRAVIQERAAQSVLEALLPVLDDIQAARDHGDLAGGPFAAIADKLENSLRKFGLERFGAAGEEFDPNVHEALMHTAWPADGSVPATGTTTVVQVLQPGYKSGEQVLRAARVAVADPE
ncbi:nucleotide exchange factor GrpE [Knoellia koreensis]|uniref:Protein GrpE n=1 Tax=Knoellia koreensis TaxID=2730921 RepID=A0A849HNH7_9MICO|nr:nucleotide exchange factor GrpE [Knoellia sp. DB2414S]